MILVARESWVFSVARESWVFSVARESWVFSELLTFLLGIFMFVYVCVYNCTELKWHIAYSSVCLYDSSCSMHRNVRRFCNSVFCQFIAYLSSLLSRDDAISTTTTYSTVYWAAWQVYVRLFSTYDTFYLPFFAYCCTINSVSRRAILCRKFYIGA